MVAQPCVCPKCKGIVHFKMVNFMLYILLQFFFKERKIGKLSLLATLRKEEGQGH